MWDRERGSHAGLFTVKAETDGLEVAKEYEIAFEFYLDFTLQGWQFYMRMLS